MVPSPDVATSEPPAPPLGASAAAPAAGRRASVEASALET